MSWVQSFPAGRDRWELVASLARERRVMPHVLEQQLRQAGAAPVRIGGVPMVRASEFERVAPNLPAPLAAAAEAVKPAPPPAATATTTAPTQLPESVAQTLQRQASALEQLRREIEALSAQMAQEHQR